MAQLPLASSGLFLDMAYAHPSAAHAVDSDTAIDPLQNNKETDTMPVEGASLDSSSADSVQPSIHPLLEPLASLSQNISKLPLLQPYRSGANGAPQETVASLFPLSANYLPAQVPLEAEEAVETSDNESLTWQSISSNTLKQWRQPSIQIVSVNVREVGRSLQIEPSASGLKQAFMNAIPNKEVAASPTPDWNAFCFSAPPPKADVQELQELHQLVINEHVVAEFATVAQANLVAKRLRSWIQEKMFSPSDLVARIQDNKVLGLTQDQVLFEVDQTVSQLLGQNRDTIAIAWVNNLRTALDVEPLSLVDAQTQLYGLEKTSETMDGTASWYGPYFHGRQTASGEYFHEGELTVAHKSLPFDTFLKVTNLENEQSVIVRVNDRGPYIGERSLDLSRNAAQCLGSEEDGVIPYHAVIMKQFN